MINIAKILVAGLMFLWLTNSIHAQTINGTSLHITTLRGTLDVDDNGFRYQTGMILFTIAPDPALSAVGIDRDSVWVQTLAGEPGIFRIIGNELFVGALSGDTPKIRIAGCDGSGGILSLDTWRPEFGIAVGLHYVYEIARLQGKFNPVSLGGLVELWVRIANAVGDGASSLVAQWAASGSGNGAPAFNPCSTPPPPPPQQGYPTAITLSTNLNGSVSALQTFSDGVLVTPINPNASTWLEVEVDFWPQAQWLFVEFSRTAIGGEPPYVYFEIDGVNVYPPYYRPGDSVGANIFSTNFASSFPGGLSGTHRVKIITSAQNGTLNFGGIRISQ